MKKFFKDNISTIVNLLVEQLALTIFGFVLAMACRKSDNLLAISSVLSIAFYLFLVYFMIYELGQKDGLRISAGRMKYNPARGALIALCANIPNLILGVLAVIGKAFISNVPFLTSIADYTNSLPDATAIAEFSASPAWAANLYGACSSVAEFIQCMYQGVCKVFFSGNVLTLLVRPLPAILFCGVAYPLGVKYSGGFHGKKKDSDRYR